MSVELVAENIYRIGVPLGNTPLKELNAYLIKGEERNLLIDTGFKMDICREALFGGLKEIGVEVENTDVFLTHMHSDHSGLSPEVASGGNCIYISSIDMIRFMSFGKSAEETPFNVKQLFLGGMPEEVLKDFFVFDARRDVSPHVNENTIVKPVEDGDIFEIAGYKLKAILTPGHTPGQMCLYEESKGILFTGDHVLFDITPNIVCWPEFPDALGQFISSLKKIDKLEVTMALPGHRRPGDLHERISHIIGHHERRLAEAMGIIRENPGATAYLVASKMRWKIHTANGSNAWDDFPITQKYFALGECQSHLAYLTKRQYISEELVDGVYRYTALTDKMPVAE